MAIIAKRTMSRKSRTGAFMRYWRMTIMIPVRSGFKPIYKGLNIYNIRIYYAILTHSMPGIFIYTIESNLSGV